MPAADLWRTRMTLMKTAISQPCLTGRPWAIHDNPYACVCSLQITEQLRVQCPHSPCWSGKFLLMKRFAPSASQVSDMRPSSSCLSWTSTTSWSWPGDSTTCCSVFSRSSPGPSASSPGTQKAVWRTPSAKTRACGWRPTPPTLPPPSQSSGSELFLATCGNTCWNRLKYSRAARVCLWIVYRRNVLTISTGIDDIGSLKWDLALCLLAVWVICFFCIWKGVKSTGKVSSLQNIIA